MPSRAELSPYIGSRSFGRTPEDQQRFFGRDREIEELVGLVVAHSVVLVYAASGAGKTSLLEAGVVPKLLDEGFEVLPRARVRADLPPGVALDPDTNPYVLSVLCWVSPEMDPAALQHRTIAEHLSALARPEGTTRVMVVDQLEELFTSAPGDWQRHQKAFVVQLREALRAIPDLRLVLVTREDFLALLDDLAPILGGLRVRFHLERLGREAARQAVEGPLASTGASRKFDVGVADQLVEDLSRIKLATQRGGDPRGVPGPHVDPVQLQIVCDALWNRLPADVKVVTAEHLEHYGDVEATLERFYEEAIDACVRATGCGKERLSHWFGDELITPSDTRRPVFRGADQTEGLPNAVVEFLARERLVHADVRMSGCWYELAHDRLIRPVRVVNARWQAEFDAARTRQQRRRRGRRVALIGGSIVFGLLVFSNVVSNFVLGAQQRAEHEAAMALALEREREAAREHALTDERIKALRERCPGRTPACDAETVRVFDSITDHYWRQHETEKLVATLKGAADLIPADYGMPLTSSPGRGDDRDEPGLLRITYNPARGVDELRMRKEWERIASDLRSHWGLPVLSRISLAADERVPASSVDVTASPEGCLPQVGRTRLLSSVQMPVARQAVLISEQEIRKDPRLSGLFDEYRDREGWTRYETLEALEVGGPRLSGRFDEHRDRDGWTRYAALEVGGPWWFVDAWSAPVWRVAGHPAVSREAVLAVVVANELLNRPDLILGCDALKALLQHAGQAAPVGVREAVAARTLEGLRRDLIEIIRVHRWSLRFLPTLLDALANRPGVATPEAARFAVQEQGELDGGELPVHGPWRAPLAVDLATLAPKGPYEDLAGALPAIEPPLRVELGPTVKPAMMDAGVLREEIPQRLDALRRDLYLRYGLLVPGVRFRDASDLRGLRIEVVNQDARNPAAWPIETPPQDAQDRLFDELALRYRALRPWWLTADGVATSLEALPGGERAWLERHHSVTDLKLLARGVAGGDEDSDGADTLRDLPWLLGSLAFWRHAYPGDATIATLARALRDTQRARLQPAGPAMRGEPGRVTADIRRGLDALGADRLGEAEGHFASAIRADRGAAIAAFLRMYPALSSLDPSRRIHKLVALCRLPQRDTDRVPGRAVEYEIEEVLGRGAPVPASERWKLALCVLRSIAAGEDRPREVERRVSALVVDAPVEIWTKEEAFALARRWLLSHRHLAAPSPAQVSAMRPLLARGVADLATAKEVSSVWTKLHDSLGARPWGWTRDLIAEVARGLPSGWPSLKLQMAYWLVGFGEDDVVQARSLVDAIDPGRTADDTWFRAWVRAFTLERLGDYGTRSQRAQRLDEAARAFRVLADQATTPRSAGLAFTELANIHVNQGDIARARQAIRDGIEISKDRGSFELQEFFIELGDGQTGRAGAIASGRLRRAPGDDVAVFLDAVFATLTRRADFEHAARNFIFGDIKALAPYKDYVRFLLYWALASEGRTAEATQLIAERMREIDRGTWAQRLAQRDTMVWREMLVAYVAGELPESEILDPLASDASFAGSRLGRTELSRDGLRCEAAFYMALRKHVTDDPATRDEAFRRRLKAVIDLEERGYFEHRMARFLLGPITS